MMKLPWKYKAVLAFLCLSLTVDTSITFAALKLEELNPNEYKEKQFKDNTEYLHNDPLLEKRSNLSEEQMLLNFLPKKHDTNSEIKKQLFQEGFEEHKTTAYESTKLLLFTNKEKVLKTENERTATLMDTRGIKYFYIAIILGLLVVTFLLLLPRFIRGTKENT